MEALSIESFEFTQWVREHLTDAGLSALQLVLMNDPHAGDVMPGCGGLLKLRIADSKRGKGKRGGIRVIYLYVPEANVIFLMDIFNKGEQEDLTANDRKALKILAAHFEQAILLQRKQEHLFMKSPKQRKPLAERLKTSLEEAIRHAQGEITLKTTVVELPEKPPEIDASTLVALRNQSGMSQAVFASVLNVSTKTVQSWEQGVRAPSHASRRLIQIYSQHPEAVCQAVGLTPISLHGVTIEKVAKTGRRKIVVQAKP